MTTPSKKLHGLGRRKSAVAQALLTTNAEERTVNGIPFDQYFPTVSLQSAVLGPLRAASLDDTHGFSIVVRGGGKHSQSAAAS
jgi:small subunit ribosomal protein S9